VNRTTEEDREQMHGLGERVRALRLGYRFCHQLGAWMRLSGGDPPYRVALVPPGDVASLARLARPDRRYRPWWTLPTRGELFVYWAKPLARRAEGGQVAVAEVVVFDDDGNGVRGST
jgi:hypothetical protein